MADNILWLVTGIFIGGIAELIVMSAILIIARDEEKHDGKHERKDDNH